jgi:hypothetical protein
LILEFNFAIYFKNFPEIALIIPDRPHKKNDGEAGCQAVATGEKQRKSVKKGEISRFFTFLVVKSVKNGLTGWLNMV